MTRWNEFHPWPSRAGLRHLAFNRNTNGFDHCCLLVGGRLLIDEEKFFEWCEWANLEAQSSRLDGSHR